VTQYVSDKIRALRLNPGSIDPDNPEETPLGDKLAELPEGDSEQPPTKRVKLDDKAKATKLALQPHEGYAYGNVSVLRGNAMKFLPNFFDKAQVCFADLCTRARAAN
jgi:tRNA (guanine-N7-)-methyltransferase